MHSLSSSVLGDPLFLYLMINTMFVSIVFEKEEANAQLSIYYVSK